MRHLAAALAAVAAVAICGCGGAASSEGGRPTVFAASSLTEALTELDPDARYNFAGSDQLAFQIAEGAPADVFAAASPRHPQALFAKGLLRRPRTFATNTLVLIVPRANRAGMIHSVADLDEPGVKLVVGDAGVPVGDYTRQMLERLGREDLLDRVVSREDDVRSVTAKVSLGEADAGFVYATDVAPVADAVRAIRLPARAQPAIDYQVGVVRASGNSAVAEAFIARLLGPDGRRVLAAHGFGLPGR